MVCPVNLERLFVFSLVAALFTRVASLMFIDTTSSVTVRRGEELQISCHVQMEAGDDVKLVEWRRLSDLSVYGSIDTSGACGAEALPCPIVNTTDNRGTIQYIRGTRNEATLYLDIHEVGLQDNTQFQCVFRMTDSSDHATSILYVIINYFPNNTYPMCIDSSVSILTCSSETGRPAISLEWTTSFNSARISLSSNTYIVGDQVENELNLTTLGIAYDDLTFTCRMTSEAYPGFVRNCSLGPFFIPANPTAHAQETEVPPSKTESYNPTESLNSSLAPSDPNSAGGHTTLAVPQTDPASVPVPLSITVTIAVAAASCGTILVLIVIIVCLLLSRRHARKRTSQAEPRGINFRASTGVEEPSDAGVSPANAYEDHADDGNRLSSHTAHIYNAIPLGGIRTGGSFEARRGSPTSPPPSASPIYANVPPANRSPTPTPASTVDASHHQVLSHGEMSDDLPPYATVQKTRHLEQERKALDDGAMMGQDNDEEASSSPYEDQGTAVGSYAEVKLPQEVLPDPPSFWSDSDDEDYDQNDDDDDADTGDDNYAADRQEERQGPTTNPWRGEVADSEAGPAGQVGSSRTPVGHSDRGDQGFVDNVLYVASSDAALINEQKFAASFVKDKKKIKGHKRLDPF